MTNDSVDPKGLCFRQEIIANSTNAIKTYLYEKNHKDIEETKAIILLKN